MVKINGNNSKVVREEVSENIGLEKVNVKQASAGNEIQYLAFIALKNITVGREHPPEPKEPPAEPKPPKDWCTPPIRPEKPKPREPEPPCRSCYSSPPPRDDPWEKKKPWEK